MKKQNQPLISVVMPAYNAGKFLVESLQSIQNQTYQNWELIIVDDASTDNTWSTLKAFSAQDTRIRIFKNKVNSGVSVTANRALSYAKGEFIARMDADDISMPSRFEKQIEYLLKNKNIVAVGTQCDLINSEGVIIGKKNFPCDFASIKKLIFERIPMQQPSIMVNKNLLPKDFVWYDKNFGAAEEIELMFKFFQLGEIRNLPEKLLQYRLHGNNTSLKNVKKTFYLTVKSRIRGITVYGLKPSLKSIFVTGAQLVLVTALPAKYIYPIFSFIHGLKNQVQKTQGTSLVVETN